MYFARIDLSKLYPPFAELAQSLQRACLTRGKEYYAMSGFRTFQEQNDLYDLGRKTRNWDHTERLPLGNIVTNAKGGQSYHNFGIALDWAYDANTALKGLQPEWTPHAFDVLGEQAKAIGLEWGGVWQFKDYPHVQLPIEYMGLRLTDVQNSYFSGGIKAVYNILDRFRW